MRTRRVALQQGETLVETLASVLILGIFVSTLYTVSTTALSGTDNQVLNEQALTFAENLVNQLRFDVIANRTLPPSNTPLPFGTVDGATFTVAWTSSGTPVWMGSQTIAGMNYYQVNSTWQLPSGQQKSLSFTFSIYPNADGS